MVIKKKAVAPTPVTRSEKQVSKVVNDDVHTLMDQLNKKLAIIINPKTLPVIDDDSDGSVDLTIPLYSTGILNLNRALSGGLPLGRIAELYGEEASGKSLISLVTIGEVQRAGGRCLLFDAEAAYDPIWATKLGVNTDNLMVSSSNIAEDVFKTIEAYAQARTPDGRNFVDLIVIDSIASLTTLAVMGSELGAPKYASLAGVLASMLPRMMGILKENRVSLIIINQVRDAIGTYVPMLKTPGGRALKHLYHTRMKVFKAGSSKLLKDGDMITGVETEAQVTKHRGGANFTTATFRIDYQAGLDRVYDVVSLLLATKHITQAGSFYTYGGQKYQGLANLMDAFRNDQAALDAALTFAQSVIAETAKHGNPTALATDIIEAKEDAKPVIESITEPEE